MGIEKVKQTVDFTHGSGHPEHTHHTNKKSIDSISKFWLISCSGFLLVIGMGALISKFSKKMKLARNLRKFSFDRFFKEQKYVFFFYLPQYIKVYINWIMPNPRDQGHALLHRLCLLALIFVWFWLSLDIWENWELSLIILPWNYALIAMTGLLVATFGSLQNYGAFYIKNGWQRVRSHSIRRISRLH